MNELGLYRLLVQLIQAASASTNANTDILLDELSEKIKGVFDGLGFGGGSSGGFYLDPNPPVDGENKFSGATKGPAESSRDVYFTSNPEQLALYDSDMLRMIVLEWEDAGSRVIEYQVRMSGSWVSPFGSGGGEMNVQSDWDETDTSSDAYIRNKPTIPVINPSIHNFSVGGSSRVGVGDSLGTRQIRYSVTNVSLISSIVLQDGTTDVANLTLPTADGMHTENIDLSGVDTASARTISFRLVASDSEGNTYNSNIDQVIVRNASPQENIYYGIGSIDPATVDVSTMQNQEVTGAGTFNVDIGPSSLGDDIVFLAPEDRDISEIVNRTLGINVIASYTRTADVRQIGGVSYNSYVLSNLNASLTFPYTIRHN